MDCCCTTAPLVPHAAAPHPGLPLPAADRRALLAVLRAEGINQVLREVLEELQDEAMDAPVRRVVCAEEAIGRPATRIRSAFDLGESRAAKRAQERALAALQMDLFGAEPEPERQPEPAEPAPHTDAWVTETGVILRSSPFDAAYRPVEFPGDKERERRARQRPPKPPKQTFTLGRSRRVQPQPMEFEDMEEFE